MRKYLIHEQKTFSSFPRIDGITALQNGSIQAMT